MTRVKVCGVTAHEDLRAAVRAGADAVGFLVDVPVESPREIPPARAVELARATPPFVTSVLVTMPGDPEATIDLFEYVEPDALQIHGEFTPGDLAYLSANVNGGVVRAVDHDEAPRFADVADALLVDSVGESGRGGTGRTHDWAHTRDVVESLDAPVVLAGGLTPGNVREAVEAVRPYAVDVASGVEWKGGRKDHDAVESFVRAAGGVA